MLKIGRYVLAIALGAILAPDTPFENTIENALKWPSFTHFRLERKLNFCGESGPAIGA